VDAQDCRNLFGGQHLLVEDTHAKSPSSPEIARPPKMNPARPVRVLDAGVLLPALVTHALKLDLERIGTPAGE